MDTGRPMDDGGVDTVRPKSEVGQWMTRAAAATLLGLSERTIRRYAALGQYRTRKVGQVVEVWVPLGGQSPASPGEGFDEQLPLIEENDAAERSDGHPPLAIGQLMTMLHQLLDREMARADLERERASAAEQAAAMWQERARNLEAQVEQLLALPAHEEEPARRWWAFWQRGA
jgi:hypothetical protein